MYLGCPHHKRPLGKQGGMTELSDSAQPGRQTGAHGHDEELVRALLNATGQGIYGVDLEGDCTFANPACVAMLGYASDQELLGENMHGIFAAGDIRNGTKHGVAAATGDGNAAVSIFWQYLSTI